MKPNSSFLVQLTSRVWSRLTKSAALTFGVLQPCDREANASSYATCQPGLLLRVLDHLSVVISLGSQDHMTLFSLFIPSSFSGKRPEQTRHGFASFL